MIYLLDSNIFIQSKNLEYRFSFCNDFWKLLIDLHNVEKVFSIKSVKNEIQQGYKNSDNLTLQDDIQFRDWINNLPNTFFVEDTDEQTEIEYKKLMNWSSCNPQFTVQAKTEFAGNADARLVAYAKAHNMNIVTHETYNVTIKKRIKIPNAAEALGIRDKCITLYDFLEQNACGTFQMKP